MTTNRPTNSIKLESHFIGYIDLQTAELYKLCITKAQERVTAHNRAYGILSGKDQNDLFVSELSYLINTRNERE